MECSRCGREAVVKRDNAVYCGKCALARDWEEIIHVVQADRLSLDPRPGTASPAGRPDAGGKAGEPAPIPAPRADARAEDSEAQAAPVAAAPPADPFA